MYSNPSIIGPVSPPAALLRPPQSGHADLGQSRQRVAVATLGLAAAGLIACSSDPDAKPKPRAAGARLLQDCWIPARLDPRRDRRDQEPRPGERLLGQRATEDARAFTSGSLRRYDAVVFLSTTGDVLDAAPAARLRALHPRAAAAASGSTPPPTPSTTGPSTAGCVGAYFKSHPAIQPATVDVDGPRTRPPRSCPPAGRGRTSGTTSAPIRAAPSTSWPRSTSPPTPAARWAPTTRSPGAITSGRPRLVHRRRPHERVLRRARLPPAPARRHPLGGGAGEGRLPRRSALPPRRIGGASSPRSSGAQNRHGLIEAAPALVVWEADRLVVATRGPWPDPGDQPSFAEDVQGA